VHNNDSFIEEVSEAVRRDRMAQALARYGWLIGALVILIVGGAAFHEWNKYRTATRSAAAGDALRAAYAEADPATRAGLLADFAVAHPDAAVLARLGEAGARAEAGETEAAAAILGELAGDGATPPAYRSLASLQRVMLLGSGMDASERGATLDQLVGEEEPFRPLALEQRALMHLDAGDAAAAIADLEAILGDPGATEALRTRARQLIIAAGGELPLAASANG
jgi:hypothetical protein